MYFFQQYRKDVENAREKRKIEKFEKMYPFRFCTYTVNVDIFACINIQEFMKVGNFVCIKICVLSITVSLWYKKVIFNGYIFLRMFKKRELLENMYSAKITTFTVCSPGWWTGNIYL